MTENTWHSRVHGLVTRDGHVLLAGQALPRVEFDALPEDLGPVARAFEDLLGARVAVLRYVDRRLDRERKEYEAVDVLELLEPDWTPPTGLEWADARALPQPFEHRELVLQTLDEPVPPQRAPWARQGWLAEASAWIDAALRERGRPPTGPVEQVRNWCLSSVLRVPTANGAVFFKATSSSPLFVDEGRVMQGLARLFPSNVPKPIAVDRSRRWMLLDDFGPTLGWDAPLEERDFALRMFAFMQVASSEHVDALLAMGCIDRRPQWVARHARKLLTDDAALAGLDEEEIARLRELEPVLVALCLKLAEGPVPDTLVHGDLHLSNVARSNGNYVYFDWSDACVSHPFLDLIDVLHEKDAAIRDTLRDAYLSVWSDRCSPERLLALWELAAPLASLNQAVSYRSIAASVEPGAGAELEGALPYWLRKVLEVDYSSLRF